MTRTPLHRIAAARIRRWQQESRGEMKIFIAAAARERRLPDWYLP
jgi:hypothetical protein